MYFLSVLGIVSLAELMVMSVELGEVTVGSVDLRKSSTAFLGGGGHSCGGLWSGRSGNYRRGCVFEEEFVPGAEGWIIYWMMH